MKIGEQYHYASFTCDQKRCVMAPGICVLLLVSAKVNSASYLQDCVEMPLQYAAQLSHV